MNAITQPDPLYYLNNFRTALSWLLQRDGDLLTADEHGFIQTFSSLQWQSQALLVRLLMRRGVHFRTSKILYPEIGCIRSAAAPLCTLQWLHAEPLLTLVDLFDLLRRPELEDIFGRTHRALTKAQWLELLADGEVRAQTFADWCGSTDECVYHVTIAPLCTRLRLLFFGSFYQDWSEFVLADLGIFRYERVDISRTSRPFQSRADVDAFVTLHGCREKLHEDACVDEVLAEIPRVTLAHPWLEARRGKLLFQLAQQLERDGEYTRAAGLYEQSRHPEARLRFVRVLERSGAYDQALNAALAVLESPASEAESQRLQRIVQRLGRRLNRAAPARAATAVPPQYTFELWQSETSVEESVRLHLHSSDSPTYYVQNGLLNSLFGLLCWEAIFAPVPGAFFHHFHSGPMDLLAPDFYERRRDCFERCFARLQTGEYRSYILEMFAVKQGVQSPFVAWGLMDDALLHLALDCIPADHLRRCFRRMLDDLQENCTGLPDLIQFWPAEQRYLMIEVKGPGDRLQDNQKRWMSFCVTNNIPVAVARVKWRVPLTESLPETTHDYAE